MTRAQIRPLVPHAGAMLLIDGVESFDEQAIRCVTGRHLVPTSPLHRDGRLASLHAIEFVAQAAAVHGGLIAGGQQAPLRALAAVREARFARPWLDDLGGQLRIAASVLHLDQRAAVYQGSLTCEDDDIASLRLTLMTLDQTVVSP